MLAESKIGNTRVREGYKLRFRAADTVLAGLRFMKEGGGKEWLTKHIYYATVRQLDYTRLVTRGWL